MKEYKIGGRFFYLQKIPKRMLSHLSINYVFVNIFTLANFGLFTHVLNAKVNEFF